jgi:hypothetical protein
LHDGIGEDIREGKSIRERERYEILAKILGNRWKKNPLRGTRIAKKGREG